MNPKLSPRPRRYKHKEEIVAQVHKSATSSENEYAIELDVKNDKNENYSIHTPSRDISVDGETQINSKIMSLIETEMRCETKKQSHFTDSRPQSLSFYEDEKIPEELSGNLELLSPEERKHYKKRKDYSQMNTDDKKLYSGFPDLYSSKDMDDIKSCSLKKSKSRKKRHGEDEVGMGDSREMIIPKEKRKSRKKKRDNSPQLTSSTGKRKHRKREDDFEPKNDVTLALDELQDDVFENAIEEYPNRPDRAKRSPRMSDKLYVQKKNKFENTKNNNSSNLNRQTTQDVDEQRIEKRFSDYHPLEIAILFQNWWMRFSTFCHGLLGGLALGHSLYTMCNLYQQDEAFLPHYAYYSDIYAGLFFGLCVICIVSVLDRLDIGHVESKYLNEILSNKKCSIVAILYLLCLAVHLTTTTLDEKISLISYGSHNVSNVTFDDLKTWNHLSLWRAILAFTAWLLMGFGPPEDRLQSHLANMEQYLPSHLS